MRFFVVHTKLYSMKESKCLVSYIRNAWHSGLSFSIVVTDAADDEKCWSELYNTCKTADNLKAALADKLYTLM